MAVEYTLLMQKTAEGSAVKSSLDDFGFAVCDIPWPDEETEEVATRQWPGVDGEDAYISPSGQKLQAYDVEVEFCYKGKVETANLLNGIGFGKNGWIVPYMFDAGGGNVSDLIHPWTCDRPYMASGYSGVGVTTGGIAAKGVVMFKSEGWSLSPREVYTLSFGIAVPVDTDHVDVYLGKDSSWGNKATDFKRITPKKGVTRYSLQFTVEDNPAASDSMCVVFNFNDSASGTAMSEYPSNTGIELFDLKLESGVNGNPVWSPSPEDIAAGSFPEWRDANTAFCFLRDYLIGPGGFLKLYDPYWKKGRKGVYVKKFHDREPHRSNMDEVLSMKVTLRVTDPKSEVTLMYVGD